MSHLSREKLDLLTRTKKIVGQLEAVGRALDQDEPCAEVLQRLYDEGDSQRTVCGAVDLHHRSPD